MFKGVILSKNGAREEVSLASGVIIDRYTSLTIREEGPAKIDYKVVVIRPDKDSGIEGDLKVTIWRRKRRNSIRQYSVIGTREGALLLQPIFGRELYLPGEEVYFTPPAQEGDCKTSVRLIAKKDPAHEPDVITPKLPKVDVLVPPLPEKRNDSEWWDEQSN